jgi:hypothetical protein
MAGKPPNLGNALQRAIRAAGLGTVDAAAIGLAKHYASLIDDAEAAGNDEALVEVGPKLLAVLEQLKLTPKARSTPVAGGGTDDRSGARGRLLELRQRAGRPD